MWARSPPSQDGGWERTNLFVYNYHICQRSWRITRRIRGQDGKDIQIQDLSRQCTDPDPWILPESLMWTVQCNVTTAQSDCMYVPEVLKSSLSAHVHPGILQLESQYPQLKQCNDTYEYVNGYLLVCPCEYWRYPYVVVIVYCILRINEIKIHKLATWNCERTKKLGEMIRICMELPFQIQEQA